MAIVSLAQIDIEHNARLGVQWLNAPYGVETLRLLGNVIPDDFKTTYEDEVDRLTKITQDANILSWSISYENTILGDAEARLTEFEGLKAPNISLFIGDITMRGRGIGTSVLLLIMDELTIKGYSNVYARALTRNMASMAMLQKAGFIADGTTYTDSDNLVWQNYQYSVAETG